MASRKELETDLAGLIAARDEAFTRLESNSDDAGAVEELKAMAELIGLRKAALAALPPTTATATGFLYVESSRHGDELCYEYDLAAGHWSAYLKADMIKNRISGRYYALDSCVTHKNKKYRVIQSVPDGTVDKECEDFIPFDGMVIQSSINEKDEKDEKGGYVFALFPPNLPLMHIESIALLGDELFVVAMYNKLAKYLSVDHYVNVMIALNLNTQKWRVCMVQPCNEIFAAGDGLVCVALGDGTGSRPRDAGIFIYYPSTETVVDVPDCEPAFGQFTYSVCRAIREGATDCAIPND